MRFTHSFFHFKLNWRRYEFKEKKQDGAWSDQSSCAGYGHRWHNRNRTLFGSRSLYQLNRSFHCTDLYDYWGFHVPHDACCWGNALPRP